jgi:hypothetical protein
MVGERKLRAALQLGPRDRVEEVGVFPQPDREVDVEASYAGVAEEEGEAMSSDLLVTLGIGRSASTEPRIEASLPSGHAKRFDADPRVLLLEGIPTPKLVLGPVKHRTDDAWLVDTRRKPAVILLERDGAELVVWGEEGSVRLFAVERWG